MSGKVNNNVSMKGNWRSRRKQYTYVPGVAPKTLLLVVLISLLLAAGCQNQSETDPTESADLTAPTTSPELTEASSSQDNQEEQGNTFVFQNVNLITMTDDQVLENQSVIIEDGLITAIGDADTITIPEGAHIIPGQGKYLMPGLFDMHVHWWRYTGEETLYLANGSPAFKSCGVTRSFSE